MREFYNNHYIGLESEVSTLLPDGSVFFAEDTRNVFSIVGGVIMILTPSSIFSHDDVEVQGVIPENGWILQFKDGKYIPSMVKRLKSRPLEINTDNGVFLEKIQEDVNFQRLSEYSFKVSFNDSIDSTGSDFECQLTVGGIALSVINGGLVKKIEGKDAGGNNGDGRGTTQIDNTNMTYYYTPTSIGDQEVILSFRGDSNNVESSMWEASILIEEIFN